MEDNQSEAYWARELNAQGKYADVSVPGTNFKTPQYSNHHYSYSNDALIFSIGADQQLQWETKIQKNQVVESLVNNPLSLNVLMRGNDLHVFYMDDKKIRSLKILKYDAQGKVTSKFYSDMAPIPIRYMLGWNNNLIGNDRNNRRNQLYMLLID